jgi:SAM-dependent methyltransferase
MKPDFGATATDYAEHRAGFPESLFERLAKFGLGWPGQAVLDLGTGTGSLGRGFARRGCNVIGLDLAEPLLAKARELDAREGIHSEYRVGRAEETGLPNGAFDVVAAGQCWHWFNRPQAATEAARLLRPNGHLLIAHFDWIPLPGNLVRITEELIERHNPNWQMGWGFGMYPAWLRDLGEAGYHGVETFSYDLEVPYTPEAWRGRIRASAGVGGTLSETAVEQFDAELATILTRKFPGPLLQIPHRVFAVIAQPTRSAAAPGFHTARDLGAGSK